MIGSMDRQKGLYYWTTITRLVLFDTGTLTSGVTHRGPGLAVASAVVACGGW
jgi:hypothetical protein